MKPGWAEVTIGEICRPKQWTTIKKADLLPDGYPVYGANGVIGYFSEYNHTDPTILIGCRGTCGVVNVSEPRSYVTGNAMALDDLDESRADIRYLVHALRYDGLQSSVTGSSQPQITRSTLERISVPLPPLEEQHQIAAILDKADELQTKRRAAIAHLDSLTQAIFLDMFGDPVANPKGWPTLPLGEISHFFAGGTLPAGSEYEDQVDGFLLLKVSDLNSSGNEVYIQTSKQWSPAPGARSATCPSGSIIIPKRGGAIGTNKKRITSRPAILDPNLMAIAPDPDAAELEWLFHWFLRLDLLSITSGSSVPQLNKKDLSPLKVRIPPRPLQAEFAEKVAALRLEESLQSNSLQRLSGLSEALQTRAFRGEL